VRSPQPSPANEGAIPKKQSFLVGRRDALGGIVAGDRPGNGIGGINGNSGFNQAPPVGWRNFTGGGAGGFVRSHDTPLKRIWGFTAVCHYYPVKAEIEQ